MTLIGRRKLLHLGLGATASLCAPAVLRAAEAAPPQPSRRISFRNLHTEERLEAVYFENGVYVPEAMEAISRVLRDHRTGLSHPVPPELIDAVVDLQAVTGSKAVVEVISGYRSPASNQMLSDRSGEVARNSLHMQGLAIDMRVADVALYRLHDAATELGRGGVGYYPYSKFLHLDVGRVRGWKGS